MQPTLPGTAVLTHGRTVTLAGLRTFLGDLDPWEIDQRIEDGRLSWAINVASAAAERREIRIPMCCVIDCQNGIVRDYAAATIARYLFGDAPLIRARKFYRALSIEHGHAYDLLSDGSILPATGSVQRRGRGGSILIPWLNIIHFLTTRRIL